MAQCLNSGGDHLERDVYGRGRGGGVNFKRRGAALPLLTLENTTQTIDISQPTAILHLHLHFQLSSHKCQQFLRPELQDPVRISLHEAPRWTICMIQPPKERQQCRMILLSDDPSMILPRKGRL